jgi:hypothetical protein
MPAKRVLRPDRLRRIPPQFSWIDHRLVRDGHVQRCTAEALALYLILVTVSDSQGLSYYGDASLCRLLAIQPPQLERLRTDLIRVGLIAWQRPLYQVLALDPPPQPRIAGVQSLQAALSRLPLLSGNRQAPRARR